MIGIATSRSAARDESLWNGVLRRAAVHFTPKYGKDLTRELAQNAAVLAFPRPEGAPNGEDAWDFMSGVAIDDHLHPLILELYGRQAGSQNAPNRVEMTPHLIREDVRKRFVGDEEVLALFDLLLKRASGEDGVDALLEGSSFGAAVMRLWRFIGPSTVRLDSASSTLRSADAGSEEAHARGVLESIEEEDEKRVRTLTLAAIEEELGQLGWQPAEIGAMARTVLDEEPDEITRPVPPVVDDGTRRLGTAKESRRRTSARTRWFMGLAAVATMLILTVWARSYGVLDTKADVARDTENEGGVAATPAP